MQKTYALFWLGFFTLLLNGCVTQDRSLQHPLKELPAAYAAPADTTNCANLDWKKYFSDSVLVQLIEEALDNNLNLLQRIQMIEVSRARIQAAKGKLLPALQPEIGVSQRKFGLYTMDGAGNSSTYITPGEIVPENLPDYFVGFQASWEIDVRGRLRNQKKATIARYLSTIEGKNWALTTLISEIAATYFQLLALDQQLEIVRETIKLQTNALAIVEAQKQAAAANELAVKQFKAQLLNSQSIEVELQQQVILAENHINLLMGRYPQSIQRNAETFSHPLPATVQTGIPSALLTNRPDIRQAELELMATRADLRAAKAAFYPQFIINGSLGYQAFRMSYFLTTPESIAYGIFGTLTAPLINRNAIKAEFKAAHANQLQALYHYQQRIITAYVEVYNQMAYINNLQRIQSIRKEEVQVLNEAIETSSDLFRTGRATYLEILTTQRNALQAKLQLIETQRQQYLATVNIYKALGGGWR